MPQPYSARVAAAAAVAGSQQARSNLTPAPSISSIESRRRGSAFANSYWLTFRISGDNAAEKTRALLDRLKTLTRDHDVWAEPSAFVLFESSNDMPEVRAAVEDVIDVETDMVIIGMLYFMKWEVVGTVRDKGLFRSLRYVGAF